MQICLGIQHLVKFLFSFKMCWMLFDILEVKIGPFEVFSAFTPDIESVKVMILLCLPVVIRLRDRSIAVNSALYIDVQFARGLIIEGGISDIMNLGTFLGSILAHFISRVHGLIVFLFQIQ